MHLGEHAWSRVNGDEAEGKHEKRDWGQVRKSLIGLDKDFPEFHTECGEKPLEGFDRGVTWSNL